jgi:deoxyribose-phosphate aldolase
MSLEYSFNNNLEPTVLRREDLASLIDHTLLRQDAGESDISRLCAEAKAHGFATVCIRPNWVSLGRKLLDGSTVKTITVIGFPSGSTSTSEKLREAEEALRNGAQELDFVINRQLLKTRQIPQLFQEVQLLVAASKAVPMKAILETSELSDEEKIIAAALCAAAGCAFVKTSTGFSKSGATVDDIRLLRSVVGPKLGVKASGGVRTYEDAVRMIEAGATRLGTSNGLQIVGRSAAASGTY